MVCRRDCAVPLDFLAVTDHAEYLGIYAQLEANDPRLNEWKIGMEWQDMMKQGRYDGPGAGFL